MKYLFFILLFPILGWTKGDLLLVGGGKRPPEAMKLFVNPIMQKKILVIPWASRSLDAGETIRNELIAAGALEVEILSQTPDVAMVLDQVANACAFFFTGGDQNKLMSEIKRLKLLDLFRHKFHNENCAFAGTSAGTAIMSNPMMSGKDSELTEGLGLLPEGVIVDQHFIVRERWHRLAKIVSDHEVIGLGIDEDNSLLLRGNLGVMIGPTEVQKLILQNGKVETTSFKQYQVLSL